MSRPFRDCSLCLWSYPGLRTTFGTSKHINSYYQSSPNVKRADPSYGFEIYIGMTKTRLRSITNSRTWMLILAPTYSTKIFYRSDRITTYVVPFVIGMLLARDSIVGIIIPSSISLPASLFTRVIMHHPTTNSLVTLLVRLIVMCITESAQRHLSDTRSDKC